MDMPPKIFSKDGKIWLTRHLPFIHSTYASYSSYSLWIYKKISIYSTMHIISTLIQHVSKWQGINESTSDTITILQLCHHGTRYGGQQWKSKSSNQGKYIWRLTKRQVKKISNFKESKELGVLTNANFKIKIGMRYNYN